MPGAPTIDFSTVKGLEPIPVAAYTATIVQADETTSKAGNTMINIQWKVSGGKYDGRIIFDSWVFTEKTLYRVKANMIALGFPKTFKGAVDPNLLVGKSATIIVEIEQSSQIDDSTGEPYPPRNRVRRVKPLTPIAATPAPAATGKK